MKYSQVLKKTILRRVLSPQNESVYEISKELDISVSTIYNWIKQAENNTIDNKDIPPNRRSAKEKFRLLINAKSVPKDKIGKWLRLNGLHSEHLSQYEQEVTDIVANRVDKKEEERKRLIKENKELKRANRKQEKALAELASLLTLKKKAQAIWGDDEEE